MRIYSCVQCIWNASEKEVSVLCCTQHLFFTNPIIRQARVEKYDLSD